MIGHRVLVGAISCLLAGCGGRATEQPDSAAPDSAARDSGVISDGEALPADGASTWTCFEEPWGSFFCDTPGGLPSAEPDDWSCHLATVEGEDLRICHGWAPHGLDAPGWSCEELIWTVGSSYFKCVKPDTEDDRPPSEGPWVCVTGTAFGGTLCERVTKTTIPSPGDPCFPGQRVWCSDQNWDGWGQALCDPATGTWATKNVNGQEWLDCHIGLADGKVPSTYCACYHPFFNPSCCERRDCIVPAGTSGQVCPAPQGSLCDPCNPQKPECTEAGAKCLITNAGESFCGRACEEEPCPAGYECTEVTLIQGSTLQCAPADLSCYF